MKEDHTNQAVSAATLLEDVSFSVDLPVSQRRDKSGNVRN